MKRALTVLTLVLLLSVFGFTQNLATVINALGARESTLTIFKQYAVPDDLTIPTNITLKFLQGGSLNISVGKSVSMYGIVQAGRYQIIEGTGTFKFFPGSNREVFPEWWGIDGTADNVQFGQACDSLQSNGRVSLSTVIYHFAVAVVIPYGVDIIGAGASGTRIVMDVETTAFRIGAEAVPSEHILIKDLSITGLNGKGIGIQIGDDGKYITVENIYCTEAEFGFSTTGQNVTFKNCIAYDNGNDTSNDGDGFVADDDSVNTLFVDCESSYHSRTGSNGFECEDAAINITFRDCVSHHNTKAGFTPHTHNGDCENVLIDGCYAYNNGEQGVDHSGTDHVLIINSFFYDNTINGISASAPVTIKNCHIYGNGAAATGWGIHLSGANKFIIEGCEISHLSCHAAPTNSGAIYASAVTFLAVKDCIITGCYGINLYQQAENMDVIIEGCDLIGDVTNGNGNGIYINNATGGTDKSLLIVNNVIKDFGANGIRLTQGKNIIITVNRIYDNTTSSINSAGAATINVQIINNNMQAVATVSPAYLKLNTIDEVLVGVPTKLTVAGGVITVIKDYHMVDGQGDANDDLDTINGFVDGMFLILQAEDDAVTITIRDNSVGGGNIETEGDAAIVLDDVEDKAYLFYDATNSVWVEISRFTG